MSDRQYDYMDHPVLKWRQTMSDKQIDEALKDLSAIESETLIYDSGVQRSAFQAEIRRIRQALERHRDRTPAESDYDLTMTERERFEAWVSAPPFEKSVERIAEGGPYYWAGHYRDYTVQLAWEAWQAAPEPD